LRMAEGHTATDLYDFLRTVSRQDLRGSAADVIAPLPVAVMRVDKVRLALPSTKLRS
jgi:hypothetical protein